MIQLSRNTTLNFKNAFNKARDELGPNSIFKFHNKLYTTNHPSEETSPNSALIERKNHEGRVIRKSRHR